MNFILIFFLLAINASLANASSEAIFSGKLFSIENEAEIEPLIIPSDSTTGRVSAFLGYGLVVFLFVFLFIMLIFYLWHFFRVPKEELIYGDMLYSSEAVQKRSAAFFQFLHTAVQEKEMTVFRFIDRMTHHRKSTEEIKSYLKNSGINEKDATEYVERYSYLRKEYTLLKLVQHLKKNNRNKETAIGTLIRRGLTHKEAVEEVEKLWDHV